jgi:hypothetical protein
VVWTTIGVSMTATSVTVIHPADVPAENDRLDRRATNDVMRAPGDASAAAIRSPHARGSNPCFLVRTWFHAGADARNRRDASRLPGTSSARGVMISTASAAFFWSPIGSAGGDA